LLINIVDKALSTLHLKIFVYVPANFIEMSIWALSIIVNLPKRFQFRTMTYVELLPRHSCVAQWTSHPSQDQTTWVRIPPGNHNYAFVIIDLIRIACALKREIKADIGPKIFFIINF
jgi:hypothetical protein